MKFMIIGLGSMGKRRVRCLKALGYTADKIAGFDLREDRRRETEEKYGIAVYADFEKAMQIQNPGALIISVPPDVHHIYMKTAIKKQIHFFVEASVVDTDMNIIMKNLKTEKIVAAPSATLLFHPAIKIIEEFVRAGTLGKISNLIYHSGQYLPDWHTYEKVSDYYVSNPCTGGGREIVPFELTWITAIFGYPQRVCGNFRKTIHIKGAEGIEDTYNFLLDYDDFLAAITVDVVSRYATRRLLINGEKKQLRWDWDDNAVKLFDPIENRWDEISYRMKSSENGYNPNIGENMYIDELGNFIEAIEGKKEFISNLEKDHKVLKLLYAIEDSDKKSVFVRGEV